MMFTVLIIFFYCIFELQEEDDLPFEEDILRNPFTIKCWLRYIEYKKDSSLSAQNVIYERALKELPGRFVLKFQFVTMSQTKR